MGYKKLIAIIRNQRPGGFPSAGLGIWYQSMILILVCVATAPSMAQQPLRRIPLRQLDQTQFHQFQKIQKSQTNTLRESNPQDRPHSTIIEAETLRTTKSGGTIGSQNMQSFNGNWSGGFQLFWSGNGPGQRLEVPIEAAADGLYSVVVHMTKASDYGNVAIGMQGRQLAAFTGYSTRVEKALVSLGNVRLRRGTNTLIFNVTGKFSRSRGYQVGIDRIDITTVQSAEAKSGGANDGTGQGGKGTGNQGGSSQYPSSSDQLNGRPGSHRPENDSNSSINLITAPGIPVGGGIFRLPHGLTLFRLHNETLTTEGFQIDSWDHHSSVLRFRWDATQLPDCRAVIWQVSTEKPKQIQLWSDSSALAAFQLDGIVGFGINGRTTVQENKGQFNFDFRKHGHLISDPFSERFYVQLIPINNPKERKPVGQPSNVITVNPPYELMTFNEDWKQGDATKSQFEITRLTAKQDQSEHSSQGVEERLDGHGEDVLDKIGGGSQSSQDDDDDN